MSRQKRVLLLPELRLGEIRSFHGVVMRTLLKTSVENSTFKKGRS